MRLVQFLKQGILSLLFPPYCLVCDRRQESTETRVCAECWRSLVPCPPEMQAEKELPPYLDAIYSVFIFDDKMQLIIHALKYNGYRSLGLELGRLVGRKLKARFTLDGMTTLVPIPLHPIKQRERGYNQAALIARGIKEVTGMAVDEKVLKRIKNTKTQTQLSAAERQVNVEGAFALKSNSFQAGQTFILIDDVITTGATMSAAARVLKEAGAVKIIGVSVAAPTSKNNPGLDAEVN